jgi:KDO2-lipid IV(A) lauroyltransferase
VSAVVRRLPRRVVLAIGRRLGRVWAALDRRHLAIAADNLRQAFPEWDEARVQATARGVYVHFATVVLDILWMEGRPVAELLALADVEGLEHLTGALSRGLGVVSPLAHLGNWEFQGVTTAPLIGPSAVVARPLDNPALDRRLVAFRASTGNIVIYKRNALPEVLRNLREGRVVGIVVDQNVQAKDGIFVRFFGRPASATTVAAALALKTGCPVVPARCVLLGNGRYRMVYGPPVEWSGTGRRAEDAARITQQIASVIEGWVRETPEQWLWLHRRWKTQPPAGVIPRSVVSPGDEESAGPAGPRSPDPDGAPRGGRAGAEPADPSSPDSFGAPRDDGNRDSIGASRDDRTRDAGEAPPDAKVLRESP